MTSPKVATVAHYLAPGGTMANPTPRCYPLIVTTVHADGTTVNGYVTTDGGNNYAVTNVAADAGSPSGGTPCADGGTLTYTAGDWHWPA